MTPPLTSLTPAQAQRREDILRLARERHAAEQQKAQDKQSEYDARFKAATLYISKVYDALQHLAGIPIRRDTTAGPIRIAVTKPDADERYEADDKAGSIFLIADTSILKQFEIRFGDTSMMDTDDYNDYKRTPITLDEAVTRAEKFVETWAYAKPE